MERVFITGASSGIGEALARHYAARGATLGLLARRGTLLRALRSTLPGTCTIHACDIRDFDAVRSAAHEFIERHGVPELVIANAGVMRWTRSENEDDVRSFREVIETNVMGLVHTFHPFIPPMRARGNGTLAGIASVAGFRGLPGVSAYSASKAAAIRYLESLRVELRGTGVRVSTVCPGFIRTRMTEGNPYPMPFLMEVDDAARRIARAIAEGSGLRVVPWPMAIACRLLEILPRPIYDSLAAHAVAARRRPGNSSDSPQA